jgi:hypothetical protein
MMRRWVGTAAACVSVATTMLTGCSSSGRPSSSLTPAMTPSGPGSSTVVATASATTSASLPHGYIAADFQGQPARPCAVATAGQEISFRIEPDVPQPSCWKVHEFRAVRIVNATGDFHQRAEVVTGSLGGVGRFRLGPGTSTLLRLPHRKYFAPGDHCVAVSRYRGSCLAIWLVTRSG